MSILSIIFIPLLILTAIIFSIYRKNNAYTSFLKGTREGLSLFKEVFPSVMAMFFAVTLLTSSGMLSDLSVLLSKVFPNSKIITDILPLVIMKPISDSASYAVLEGICVENINSFECKMASVIHGCSENTFFVISLYFASIGIVKWKKALHVGLIADVIGIAIGIILSIIFLR